MIICLYLFMLNSSFASLLIAPTRVSFDERTRSSTVNLVNTSNKTNTYRLHWAEQIQLPNGKYQDISAKPGRFPTASEMLRFSPRQVTLKPGERQTVRLLLRRKSGLKIGDYRSHLVFQKLPDPDELSRSNTNGARFQVKVNLGFSIPVIVRQGKFQSAAKISNLHMLELNEHEKILYGMSLDLNRKGPNSVYGTIKVFWKPRKTDNYKQVALLNNVAIYPELSKRTVRIGIKEFKKRTGGYIKVVYVGANDLSSITFDQMEKKINTQSYQNILPKELE